MFVLRLSKLHLQHPTFLWDVLLTHLCCPAAASPEVWVSTGLQSTHQALIWAPLQTLGRFLEE